MLGYVEGILAEQAILMEEQGGLGFFEPTVFTLGQALPWEDGGGLGYRSGTVYPGGSSVEGDGVPLGVEKPLGAKRSGEETGRGFSFGDVLQQELVSREVVPGEGTVGDVVQGELVSREVMPGGGTVGDVVQGELLSREVMPGGGTLGEVLPVVPMERELGLDFGRGLDGDVEALSVAWAGRSVGTGRGTVLGGGFSMDGGNALAQGEFPMMEAGTARLLAESVMVLERQLLEMGVENVLLSGEEMGLYPLRTEDVAREMVYQSGDRPVMPGGDEALGREFTRMDGIGVGDVVSMTGSSGGESGGNMAMEQGNLLPWAVEGMASVLPGGFSERGEDLSAVAEVALMSQMRSMDRATVGKSRVEREAVSTLALEQVGKGVSSVVTGTSGVTVEDFDRAVARDARRYDGI